MVIPVIVIPVQVQLALRVPLVKIGEVTVTIAIHPDQMRNIPPVPLPLEKLLRLYLMPYLYLYVSMLHQVSSFLKDLLLTLT